MVQSKMYVIKNKGLNIEPCGLLELMCNGRDSLLSRILCDSDCKGTIYTVL